MSLTRFAEDAPRLGLADIGAVLPANQADAVLSLDVEIDDQAHQRQVALTTTNLPGGGRRRWWWVCPRCGRRAGFLYLVDDVLCRRCAGLAYASEFSS